MEKGGGGGKKSKGDAPASGGAKKKTKKSSPLPEGPPVPPVPARDIPYANLEPSPWTRVAEFCYAFITMGLISIAAVGKYSYEPFEAFCQEIGFERIVFHCCCMPVLSPCLLHCCGL